MPVWKVSSDNSWKADPSHFLFVAEEFIQVFSSSPYAEWHNLQFSMPLASFAQIFFFSSTLIVKRKHNMVAFLLFPPQKLTNFLLLRSPSEKSRATNVRFVRFNDVCFSPTCLLSWLIFPNFLEWREHSLIQKYLEEKLHAKCNYGPASCAGMAAVATLRWEWTVGGFWGGAWHTLCWWQHLAEEGLWF